jgi:hypothetical protein
MNLVSGRLLFDGLSPLMQLLLDANGHWSLPIWAIFRTKGDRLLALYEAEDQYYGRLLGVAYAEIPERFATAGR